MSAPKNIQLPWQGFAALAAAIAGAVLYFAPLDTSRPTDRQSVTLRADRDQDVDARLWQDPLAPAVAHEAQVQAIDPAKHAADAAREEQRHSVSTLCHRIAEAKAAGGHLLVLPVLMDGGSYPEYTENRLRMRRAVLEALGTNQLSPNDGEHIGYVRIPWLASGLFGTAAATNETATGDKPDPQELFLLPYEWCGPAFVGHAGGEITRVLVLWIREEELNNKLLSGLSSLLAYLDVDPASVKIIGPRTSASLRAMVDEVTGPVPPTLNLKDAVILSPTATVWDDLLLDRSSREAGFFKVKQLLEDKVNGLTFDRITATDDQVCRSLIVELGRRQVHLDLRNAPPGHEAGKDHVALISEWDTYYGRTLPLSFAREVANKDLDTLSREYPTNLHPFHYLRGIDGMLPGSSNREETRTSAKTETSSRPREATEGLNQADSLRRLALELQELNRKLCRDEGSALKAVGVLGSDVYDKLMVLKALRPALPGIIFFTNNLDARFGHPDEWHWTRNLVIASPFGLQLTPFWPKKGEREFDLQGKILPFRDSYQTATYAAALFASNEAAAKLLPGRMHIITPDDCSDRLLGEPRLFEVGRSGALELQGELQLAADPCQDIQPDPDRRWRNSYRERAVIFVGVFVALLVGWAWIVAKGVRREPRSTPPAESRLMLRRGSSSRKRAAARRAQRFFCRLSSWVVFAIGGAVALLSVALLAHHQSEYGEPYLWTEGISIWPTETLRVLVVIMAGWFFLKTNHSLKENEGTILEQFGLYSDAPLRRLTRISQPWWRRATLLLSVRTWCADCGNKVIAQQLWRRYIRSSNLSIQLLRVLPFTIFFLAGAYALSQALGVPPVPARGPFSFEVDRWLVALAAGCSIGLTFYIADATMLNRHLINYLVVKETKWPRQAYENLRRRWKVSATQAAAEIRPRSSLQRVWWRLWPPNIEPAESLPPTEIPPERLLDEYLDIDLIATRTEVVGSLIYYPFVLITLLIVSRISLFDNWTWPPALFVALACNGGYAIWSAAMLRRTAEHARQTALKNLNDILIARTAEGLSGGAEAQTARETINMISAEDRGAFAAISRHPLIGALLLPSGGAGIWALTQYLPNLF